MNDIKTITRSMMYGTLLYFHHFMLTQWSVWLTWWYCYASRDSDKGLYYGCFVKPCSCTWSLDIILSPHGMDNHYVSFLIFMRTDLQRHGSSWASLLMGITPHGHHSSWASLLMGITPHRHHSSTAPIVMESGDWSSWGPILMGTDPHGDKPSWVQILMSIPLPG